MTSHPKPAPSPRALVTGGSGYFGELVVRALLARNYRVRVLDLVDVPDRPSQVEFVRGDIRDARLVTEVRGILVENTL